MICQIPDCERLSHCRGWCNRHYQRWYKYGDPEHTQNVVPGSSLEDRLRHYGWAITETGCWEWKASRIKSGYGRIGYKGKTLATHRVAYEVWNGPIPDGMIVRHKCDNPPCINPAHLEVGTHQDNTDDKIARQRVNSMRGSRHYAARLTEEAVREIRTRYALGTVTQRELGEEFGVTYKNISEIVRYRTWKTLDAGEVDIEAAES